MTPDRIAGFLRSKPTGAQRVQLVVEMLTDVQQVAEWQRESVETPEDAGEVAGEIVAQAQDLADAEGERKKFLIRWMGASDRPLKSTTHYASPGRSEEQGAAAVASDANIVRDLLRHIAERERMSSERERALNGALSTITTHFEKTIGMLSEQLTASLQREREQPSVEGVSLSPELVEESIQRTEALKRLSAVLGDKLPDALDVAITVAAQKFLPPVPAKKKAAGHLQVVEPDDSKPEGGDA